MSIANIVGTAIQFYGYTILLYILLSWLREASWAVQLRETLAPVCEPYLGLFRRIVPTTGAVDFSPLVALIVLQLAGKYIVLLLP